VEGENNLFVCFKIFFCIFEGSRDKKQYWEHELTILFKQPEGGREKSIQMLVC